MRVLVVYATGEGQTRKVAARIAAHAAALGHAPTLVEAARADERHDPAQFDATVAAASLHAGRYQPALVAFARRHAGALDARPSAFVSVSLSAAGDDPGDRAGLARCVEAFADETGRTIRRLHHAAGALRFTRYGPLVRWVMRLIARRRGQRVDPHVDAEYTDWAALDGFVHDVLGSAQADRRA